MHHNCYERYLHSIVKYNVWTILVLTLVANPFGILIVDKICPTKLIFSLLQAFLFFVFRE